MTEKIFTEEDYQKIVDIADEYLSSETNFLIKTDTTNDSIWFSLLHTDLASKHCFSKVDKEIMAIANPVTREWAHDQFVEQEKKYIWKSKKADSQHEHFYLKKIADAIVTTYEYEYADKLTESEIREWGYNPDMFEREDVESKKTIYSADIDEDLGIFESINKQIQKIIDGLDNEDSSTDAK